MLGNRHGRGPKGGIFFMEFKEILEPIVEKLVNEQIDKLISFIMEKLIGELPFLGMKFLNPIAEYFIRKLVVRFFEWGLFKLDRAQIRFRVYQDKKEMIEARDKVIEAIKEGDENAINEADQKLIEASDNLLKLGRSFLQDYRKS